MNVKNYKLYEGDCLELMKDIPDGSIDAIICDPPYGTTACKWDSIIPFAPMWEQLHRVVKPNGAIALFGSEPFSSALRMSNIKNYKYDWVWNKGKGTTPLLAKFMPMKSHEIISLFYRKPCTYNPQKTKGKPYKAPITGTALNSRVIGAPGRKKGFLQKDNKTGDRYPLTVLYESMHCGSKIHPTQKPVALMEYLIKTYTNEGETVLDFTMGSGSTGVACAQLGRRFVGIELDYDYFKIAEKRIREAYAQPLLFSTPKEAETAEQELLI